MFQMTQTIQLLNEQGEAAPPRLSNVAVYDYSATLPPAQPVTNQQVAEVLFNIATVLTMQQDNPYRIAAYENAARGMMALRTPVAEIIAAGVKLELPGLGERLRRKITELVTTGRMTFYDDLCEESLPEDVRDLMSVAHVGPRTALRLTGHLGIHSVAELWEAAHNRRLREHHGFGPRSEQRLAEGAAIVLQARQMRDEISEDHEGAGETQEAEDGASGASPIAQSANMTDSTSAPAHVAATTSLVA